MCLSTPLTATVATSPRVAGGHVSGIVAHSTKEILQFVLCDTGLLSGIFERFQRVADVNLWLRFEGVHVSRNVEVVLVVCDLFDRDDPSLLDQLGRIRVERIQFGTDG